MSYLSKHWLKGFVLALAILIAVVAYGQGRDRGRIEAPELRQEITKLDTELGRARTDLVASRTLLDTLKEENAKVLADLEKANAKVVGLGELVATLESSGGGDVVVKTIVRRVRGECPIADASLDPDFEGIEPHDGEPLDCGTFGFSDFRLDTVLNTCTRKFNYHLSQNFRVRLIEAETPDAVTLTYVGVDELDLNGEIVGTFDIKDFTVKRVRKFPQKSLSWWTPHVDFGLAATSNLALDPNVSASIGFITSGYGLTENDQDYRIGRFSLDFNGHVGLGISPVGVNLSKLDVPLVSDLWVWPTFQVSATDKFLGFTLSTTL